VIGTRQAAPTLDTPSIPTSSSFAAIGPKYGDRQDFGQATDSSCVRFISKDHSRSGKAVGRGIVSARVVVKLALAFPTGLCRVGAESSHHAFCTSTGVSSLGLC
jgi:hypothetical protein